MYPLNVEVNEKNILKVTSTFKAAYADILGEIEGATNCGVANRKAILAQIQDILEELGTDVQSFVADELPQYYEIGADDAVKQLKNVGAPVKVAEGFNRIHKDAIISLVDDTARAFGETMSGVYRGVQTYLGKTTRDILLQKMATGQISGQALREAKRELIGTIREQGLTALTDRGGHSWTLERYTEMLFRTKAVETRNRGLMNRIVENDYDLVQVSNHNANCDLCSPWEGKILSVTGNTPGYETLDEAEADGLFHPNCKHAINTLIPSLAKETEAYNPNTGDYE
jgi:hypothetical protein